MIEEISPQTIALLIILRLYLSDGFPECKCLLLFIARSLEGVLSTESDEHLPNSTLLSLCQSFGGECHKQLQERSEQVNVDDIYTTVNSMQLEILRVWWNIDSADQLLFVVNETYDFVTKLLSISYHGPFKFSQRSAIGRFVQGLAVSMKLLHFDESSQLFSNFCLYRQSSLGLLKTLEHQNRANINAPLMLHEELFHSGHENLLSADEKDQMLYQSLNANLGILQLTPQKCSGHSLAKNDTLPYMESLVENQIQLLQRYGTSTPQDLRLMLNRIASSYFVSGHSGGSFKGEISSIHYLTYLETLHSGDYRGAFDSLHRYFDYMVSKGSRYFYHFALVSKASLHQHFGENEKALDSIEAAICVARENKDNSTLTYILSWLFDFVRKNPSLWDNRTFSQIKSDLQLLDSFVRKSLSVSLLLAAISYRAESEYLMNSRACFAKYYESLFKSNYLAMNDHVSSFIGTCHATTDLWTYVGFPHLAHLYAELGIEYSESSGSSFDLLEFRFRKGHGDERHYFISRDDEGVAQNQELYHKCLLQYVNDSIRRGRVRLAYEILDSLLECEALDQYFHIERRRLIALLESKCGNYTDALAALNPENFNPSEQSCLLQSHLISVLKLNLTRAKILIESINPMKALTLTWQQMETAKILGFLTFLSEGSQNLVQVLVKADSISDAYALALSAIPLVLCIGDPSTTSSIFYELACLCLHLLKTGDISTHISKKDLFNQCLNFLSMSISGFKSIGDSNGLSKCFELETEISKGSFLPDDTHHTNLLSEFSTHSRKGLEILKNRTNEQRSHGYLQRRSQ